MRRRYLLTYPEHVALYISKLTTSGLKPSSIRIIVAAISSVHKLNLLNDPTQHPTVKIEVRRIHRTLGRYSQQAFGITAPILEKMLEVTAKMKCSQINRIYKRLARDANFPREVVDHISGHSMRVGAAQDLLKSGASMPMIMNKGRWSKTDTIIRYLESTHLI